MKHLQIPNVVISIALILTFAFSLVSYAGVADSAGSLAVWHMDSNPPSTVYDDDSAYPGRNRNLTLSSTGWTRVTGTSGYALHSDGADTTIGTATIGWPGHNSVKVEFDFKADSLTGGAWLVSAKGVWVVSRGNDDVTLTIWDTPTTVQELTLSDVITSTSTWYHVKAYVDSSGFMYLRVGSTSTSYQSPSPMLIDTASIYVANKSGTPRSFAGAIDEIRIGVYVDGLINQAGNFGGDPTSGVHDDLVRYEILEDLIPIVDGTNMESELNTVLTSIDRWLTEIPMGYDDDFEYEFPSSELNWIVWFYRARMRANRDLESGDDDHSDVYALMEDVNAIFPDNTIAKMYLGEAIPSPYTYTYGSEPWWARVISEALERETDVLEWWIDNRQRSDGQYGGGWDDDVEMWRVWMPVLVGFDDPNLNAAEELLAENMFKQPNMALGYDDFQYDVQHTSEPSADTITPMLMTEPNQVWEDRALVLADLMEDLWTGVNSKGYLQFKSTYMASNWVSTDPIKACDTVYHPRAVQPALLYWQRTGDSYLTSLFTDWMDTWVDAAASTYLGKPAGVFPSAVHWQDGNIGGKQPDFPDWWDPHNHPSEPTLYEWPSAFSFMTKTMLLTWYMTGNDKYLEPITDMADIRMTYGDTGGAEGTVQWCAANAFFVSSITATLAKYRFITGDETYDSILTNSTYANKYLIYQIIKTSANFDAVIAKLSSKCADALRYNFEAHTSELRYTDRLFKFNTLLPSGSYMYNRKPDTSLLYAVVTGESGLCDAGSHAYFPMNAVRWLTGPRKIATFVEDATTRRFTALLYNFDASSRAMGARLYKLAPQIRYAWKLTNDSGAIVDWGNFEMDSAGTDISFSLPPDNECVLSVYDPYQPSDSTDAIAVWHMDSIIGGKVMDDDGLRSADNNLTISAPSVSGVCDKALQFNGTFDTLGTAAVSWPGGTTVKVELDFKPTDVTTGGYLITAKSRWVLWQSGNQLIWTTYDSGLAAHSLTSTVTLSNNQWYHVVATISGTTKTLAVNSQLDTATAATMNNTSATIYVGGKNTGAYLTGILDEIKVSIPSVMPPAQASIPSPSNGATDVSAVSPTLTWTAGSGATSHDVYFGTSSSAVTNANHASSEYKGNWAAASYNPGSLTGGTTYYWRIDGVNSGGTATKGVIWSFTTLAPVTLFADGFETSFDKWTDGGTTNWDRTTSYKHSGGYSAHAGDVDDDLISDNINTSGCTYMTITFWYRDDDIDDSDNIYFQLYDGSVYDNKFELGNTSPEDTWHKYETTIYNTGSDTQYFRSNFRIKFEGSSIDSGENLWIDDVSIVAERQCFADFDESGEVNFVDFAVFAAAWQSTCGQDNYNDICDLEDNDIIDVNDLALFCADWL